MVPREGDVGGRFCYRQENLVEPGSEDWISLGRSGANSVLGQALNNSKKTELERNRPRGDPAESQAPGLGPNSLFSSSCRDQVESSRVTPL